MKFLRMAQSGQTLPRTLQFLSESPQIASRLASADKFSMSDLLVLYKINALR